MIRASQKALRTSEASKWRRFFTMPREKFNRLSPTSSDYRLTMTQQPDTVVLKSLVSGLTVVWPCTKSDGSQTICPQGFRSDYRLTKGYTSNVNPFSRSLLYTFSSNRYKVAARCDTSCWRSWVSTNRFIFRNFFLKFDLSSFWPRIAS